MSRQDTVEAIKAVAPHRLEQYAEGLLSEYEVGEIKRRYACERDDGDTALAGQGTVQDSLSEADYATYTKARAKARGGWERAQVQSIVPAKRFGDVVAQVVVRYRVTEYTCTIKP